jgi:DNA-directed RNA polymerase specialized sigma24 family protein
MLVEGVRTRNPAALSELHDRFTQPMLRILLRILGPDRELADLHHDAFVRALESIGELRDPQALPSWMAAVAVHTARAAIERRTRRRRWLLFLPDDSLPEPDNANPLHCEALLRWRDRQSSAPAVCQSAFGGPCTTKKSVCVAL